MSAPKPSLIGRIANAICTCGPSDPTDYALYAEKKRSAKYKARFKALLTQLQVQLGAKPRGLHPRDQIFSCVLHLYAHEVCQLYSLDSFHEISF